MVSWNISYTGWVIYVIGALLLLGVIAVGVGKKVRYIKSYKRLRTLFSFYNTGVILFVISLLIAGLAIIICTGYSKHVPINAWKVQYVVGWFLLFIPIPGLVFSIFWIVRDFYWLIHYQRKIKKFDPTINNIIIERQNFAMKHSLVNHIHENKRKNRKQTNLKNKNKKTTNKNVEKNRFSTIASSYQASQNRMIKFKPNKAMERKFARKDYSCYVQENKKQIRLLDRKIIILVLIIGTIILGFVFATNGILHNHKQSSLFSKNLLNSILIILVIFNMFGIITTIRGIFLQFIVFYGQVKGNTIFRENQTIIMHDIFLTCCFFGLFFVNLGAILS